MHRASSRELSDWQYLKRNMQDAAQHVAQQTPHRVTYEPNLWDVGQMPEDRLDRAWNAPSTGDPKLTRAPAPIP